MVKKPKFMFMHVKATNLFKFNIMSSIEKHLKIASLIELIPIVGFIVEYFLLLPLLQITISSFYIEKTKKLGKTTKSKRSKKKK